MSGHDRTEKKLRELLKGVATSPVRWDRVDLLARKRALRASISLVAIAIALIAILSIGAIAGKTALDPSFSPPILSRASASIEINRPRLGWGLVPPRPIHGGAQSSNAQGTMSAGYLVHASLDFEGVGEEALFASWQLRRVNASASAVSVDGSRTERVTPVSGNGIKRLRQWLPMPRNTGRYVVEVDLRSPGGSTIASARSVSFYVLGRGCCMAYETPTYTARLPKRWFLQEDYASQPGSRYVTLARGPYDNSLVIDTTPHESGDALDSANELERLLTTNGIGYRRLSRRLYHLDKRLVVEWSYELEGDAFTDILFYRGSDGFAVLGRSNQDHFRETRDLTRLVARSVHPN